MKRRVVPIVLLLLAPHAALAANPPKGASDPAAAQTLFYEARALMEKGKYTEACPKLEESMRLDQGVGTQFNLADCNEHIGKVATAWAGFLDVAAQSKATNQPDREKLARKRAQALEPRLPKLVVEVPTPLPGLEVRRDGVVIGAAAWGTPIPVDAGSHKITASAPGKQTWEKSVPATEGKTARVAIPRELPNGVAVATAPADASMGPPAPSGEVSAASMQPIDPAQSFPPPVVESRGGAQRALGWVAAGVGVVGLGLGAGFGLSSLSKRDESGDHCIGNACDATGVGLRDDAIQSGNIATVATIAGGAALAGGLLLVLTAPRDRERSPQSSKIRAVPTAALGGGGFTVQGAF